MSNKTLGCRAAVQPWFIHRVLLAVLGMLLAFPLAMHAQTYYGTIVGNVTDGTGAAVPGAVITVRNVGTNNTFTATSTGHGSYSVAQLAVGTYEVHVTAGNFKEFISTGVEVHVSTTTEVNATLQVGAVSEKVTVQANDVQVQTVSAEVGEVIDGTQVRELPLNGENFVGLTQLSPGVSAAASYDGTGKGLSGGVNFSVNGNPYTNNLFLVDGVNNNDVGSNRTILVYPGSRHHRRIQNDPQLLRCRVWPGIGRHHQPYDEIRHKPASRRILLRRPQQRARRQ